MLPIGTPPGPSVPAVKGDEQLEPGHGGSQTPSFSIRDYVLASRRKNIRTNWPFAQHRLQLCLKHGLKDLLPPFEPPDLVRAQCCNKGGVESKHQFTCSEVETGLTPGNLPGDTDVQPDELPEFIKSASCSPSDDRGLYEVVKEYKRRFVQDVLDDEVNHCQAEIESTVSTHERIERNLAQVHVSKGDSEESSESEGAIAPALPRKPEASEKKSKLIVKLGSISAITRSEDLQSISGAVLDTMASKVCPVCKVFVSTSNTTLNAHIDQCLASENSTKNIVTNFSKIKVKPRKKRLMVDIYTTAPHCTLEDLHRRNGTTWASDLSVVAPTSEANVEVKRRKLSPVDPVTDEIDGAVYVDSNGIKLRILSKFNDAPALVPKECLKLKKHAKVLKAGKSCLISQKSRFGPKYQKMKPQSKKFSSFKRLKNKIQTVTEEDSHGDSDQLDEESSSQSLNAEDGKVSSGLRQGVCSKHSDILEELNETEIHGNLETTEHDASSPLAETNQPESIESSAVQSHNLKFSRPSNSLLRRSMDVLSTTTDIIGNEMMSFPKLTAKKTKWCSESNSSPSGLMLKLSRSAGIVASSPRSKREEVCGSTSPKADDLPGLTTRASDSCQTILTASNSSAWEESTLVKSPPFSSEASKGDTKQKCAFKKLRKHRSMAGTSKQGKLTTDANGQPHVFSIQFHQSKFLKGNSGLVMKEKSGEEKVKSMSSEMVVKAPGKEVVCEPLNRNMEMDDLTPASSTELEREAYVDEHIQSGYNVQLDALLQTSFEEPDEACHAVGTNTNTAYEMGTRVEQGACRDQNNDYQTENTSILGSSTFMSSHEEMGLEIPQEDSSITSNRMLSSNTENLAIDRELVASPASTASTISPSTPTGSKFNDLAAEPLLSSTRLQQSENSTLPPGSNDEGAGKTHIRRKNQEIGAVMLAKEPLQLSDGHPCCCSRQENLPKESQFRSQHLILGRQVTSNLQIRPAISTFGPYSSLKPDVIARVVESPTGSISTMTSSDSAARFQGIGDFGSPNSTQSSSKPVLRLMGKNLTVASKEEVMQLPSPVSESTPLRFPYYDSQPHQNHHQHLDRDPIVFSQAPSMVSYPVPLCSYGMPVASPAPIFLTSQKRLSKKDNTYHAPDGMREVIVIDDAPDHQTMQRASLLTPSAYFHPHSQILPKDVVYSSFRPSFSVSCPRVNTATMQPGSTSHTLQLRPSSICHLHPSLFYSEKLRQ